MSSSSSSRRYIPHTDGPPPGTEHLTESKDTISTALNITVPRVIQANREKPPPSAGVYIGVAGIAHMTYDLSSLAANILPSGLVPKSLAADGDQFLLSALQTVLQKPKSPSPSRCAFLETDVGIATLVLLRVLDTKGESPFLAHWETCAGMLRGAVGRAGDVREYEDGACEVLYARAGLLYSLLRIRHLLAYHPAAEEQKKGTTSTAGVGVGAEDPRTGVVRALKGLTGDEPVGSVVRAVVEIGRLEATVYRRQLEGAGVNIGAPPLMWSWHGTRYLGAAHGVAGILHVLWNCPKNVLDPYVGDLAGTLEWLLDCQDSSGNWPSKAPDGVRDPLVTSDLVQWCHGATGIVIFLCTALRRDLDGISLTHELRRRLVAAVYEGARLIHRQGLLRKGVGICHGVAGSVYALLAASRVLDDNHSTGGGAGGGEKEEGGKMDYLMRAVHLAHLATEYEELMRAGEMKVPDRPWSLYEGAAGMCEAWAEVLCRLEGGRVKGVPGFDDI
ncbi:putative lanthionine synthetase C-like protein [Lyophyllum shimeji]|uniref:Lanthionine synthetase C-like protein n=1 Tax=Lyophyllum shimeji TaxID=47721 RepID=A0A9P3USL1_LYOSH|nr:putative lanthionine synthetase C-like protein [Lyophyllum shimeji]